MAFEIGKRLPVWHAMSDLFLDTQLEPEDYRRIARVLRESSCSSSEARQILEEEVAPAFTFNLNDIAGEWAGWSEEQVREIMLRSLARRSNSPIAWLRRRAHSAYLRREWEKIQPLL